MNSVKRELKAMSKELPDDCTYEDVQYHLYVLSKIENGIARAEKEGTISQKDIEKKYKTWLAE